MQNKTKKYFLIFVYYNKTRKKSIENDFKIIYYHCKKDTVQ